MSNDMLCSSVGISSTWGRSEPFSWSTQMQKKVSFKQPGKPLAAPGFRIQCNKWAILVRLLLGGEDWGLGAVQDSPREVLRDICSRPDAQSHRKTPPQRHQDWTTQHKHLVLENLPS
ncbi:hypothetical protein DY000_02023905 [Brassica cretica]|uniref:Uncharacterized protein n=1 Tax=Brassica cretica TaxID=69181 RepID=A0ABQ7EL38_BRACR|nr:hypothetical protein DY000_02023905 [Brassica cretica]